ncbi:UNVERIFIED_CONTAM: RING-H2 finger protein ATL56 [Sesamum angustifolium]|uniref:RING-H2 finger protein ATL56 n=1 Tax=Sesamum angustifolium TaxID=2727405 RepID=A0AAW2PWS5_9LAMI
MPISNQENHRPIHHRAPPQYLSRGQSKILLFFLKWIIMVVVMAIFLFFLGFAAVVLFHLLLLSNTFNRRCTRFFHPNSAAAAAAEGLPPMQDLFPVVAYSAAAFPRRSDCAICLDSFEEGDECRNLPVCKHLFHTKCVDRWIGKKPTCPVCRTRVDLDPAGLAGSRIWEDDRWKRLWAVDFEEGTSY